MQGESVPKTCQSIDSRIIHALICIMLEIATCISGTAFFPISGRFLLTSHKSFAKKKLQTCRNTRRQSEFFVYRGNRRNYGLEIVCSRSKRCVIKNKLLVRIQYCFESATLHFKFVLQLETRQPEQIEYRLWKRNKHSSCKH